MEAVLARRLWSAVRQDDAEAARKCIDSGADVAIKDESGDTPLHYASKHGSLPMVKVLLDAGANPDATNDSQQTPLQYASERGKVKITKLLFESKGRTPVQTASTYKQRPKTVSKNVITNNQTIKSTQVPGAANYISKAWSVCISKIVEVLKLIPWFGTTKDLSTHLHLSAARGSPEGVDLPFEKIVDPDAENLACDTPLYLSLGREIVSLLATVANISKSSATYEVFLDYARNEESSPALEALDVSLLSQKGNTRLHIVCLVGHTEAVDILLENHANPNSSTESGHTPLHYASLGGYTKIVQRLIDVGADVNAVDRHGCTALHYAGSVGHISAVEELVRCGADLQNLSDAGKSVLHYASFYGRLEVVQRLVIEHPDLITFRDKLELSAEDTADIRGQVHSAWWLRKQAKRDATYKGFHGCRMDVCKRDMLFSGSLSFQCASKKQEKDAGVLASSVDFGLCEIHFQDRQGWTLLHAAAEQNNLPIIRILLERGALPTALTFNGKTPSDFAREKGHLQAYNMISNYICETKGSPEELFVALLSLITETAYYNAYAATTPHDLESTDASPKGQNPSLSAVRKASSLLTSGAPLEPPGSHTCYPLHLAITANCTPLLPLLLAAGAPLTATRDGLGPVQLAWLTPDITTWVAVLVTRAVRDRIAMEMQPLDDALQAAARALLEALDGERPWEAALERPAGSSDSLDALLFRAARGGASTLAWWIWNSGGSAVSRHHQDATPLHAALDGGHLGTARALALHMGGNLFLPDTDGRLPISLMSSEIIQESLAREYTILEQEKEKAKNSASCREVFEEALLLLVLCLEFNPHVNSPDYPDERWRTVLAWVLSVHGNGIASEGNRDWIQDIFDNIARILPKENVDNEAIKQAEETEESDYKVLLESISKIHQAYWREFSELSAVFGDVSSGSLHENNLDTLLKSAMIKACEKDMPLFLHLLTCVVGANISDEVCGGFPLHYAALHNNMSAARYILSQGASPSVQDRFGNTPAHYAYMFGHQEVGDFLKTDIKNSNGLPAESMLKGYNHYLKLYKLDSNSLQKRKMQRDNTASQIIQEHLQYLRRIWMENSISQAVQECHVDFTSDETRAIKKSVSEFIQKLILSITTINPMYKGDLQMLGSSEDNVRLFCPDEFDFNIIIQNMNINFPVTWKGDLRDGSVKLDKALNELLLDLFYCTVRQCLVNCEPEDRRLAIVLPGVKKTQVGVSLSLVWTGEVFPLLLVDVDVVATARASWPPALRRPKLTPSTLDSVYLNSIGNNEWRFSFALAENAVMKSLTADKRRVFLACKMVLSALKVEKWAPRHVQNQFKYFHGRFFKIPSPKGFLLKNTFFLELEEVTDEEQWTEEHLVERMTSVFRRMCEEHTDPASQETSWEPAAVKAYFADLTQSPCVGFGAPEILNFLKSLDSQLNQFQLQSNRKRHRGTYEYTLEK